MGVNTLRRPVRKVGASLDLSDITSYVPDFSGSHDEIVAELTAAFLAAYELQAPNAPINTALREQAAAFARERASDLIEDLEGATKDRVQELVAQTLETGQSINHLRDLLREAEAFSKDRADTIARTETAYALGRGQRAAAEAMQQDEKKWIAEESACEVCAQNADGGWTAIDATFAGGDDNIPSHPKCRCTCIYRTRRVHEDEAPALVKQMRCPDCHRLLGRSVNVGAQLWCQRCREEKIVTPLTGVPGTV